LCREWLPRRPLAGLPSILCGRPGSTCRRRVRTRRRSPACTAWIRGVSAESGGAVELGYEFAVGGAGCGEVFVAFVEGEAQVDHLLPQVGDLQVKSVDIGWGVESGLAPGLVAEGFGEPLFEMLDAGAQPVRAFVCGEQVGLQ
jgi:hypothetical protein